MGFSTSIHVATTDADRVLAALRRLGEHDCIVGRSGDNWIGVYSWKCEDGGAAPTPQLASKLSEVAEEHVLGVCLGDDDFEYWLFRHRKLLDQRPVPRMMGLFRKNRAHELLNLAKNAQLRQQMEAALVPKKRPSPNEILGVTDEEFIAQTYRDLARIRKMSPDEREQMEEKYARLSSPHYDDFRIVCEALGLTAGNWNYSELARAQKTGDKLWPGMDLRFLE